MKKRLKLKKLKGDIWNLKPVLTDVEIGKIIKEYHTEMKYADRYDVIAIDCENMPCVCRDLERRIVEKIQKKLLGPQRSQVKAESENNLLESCKKALAAIHSVYKAFGAPGDYGYGTPKGDALNSLYGSSGGLAKNINKAEGHMPKVKKIKQCRVCGCTDDKACPGGCCWVEDDLCSQCKS